MFDYRKRTQMLTIVITREKLIWQNTLQESAKQVSNKEIIFFFPSDSRTLFKKKRREEKDNDRAGTTAHLIKACNY